MALNLTSNVSKFISEIDKLIVDHNLGVMDAVVHYCDTHNMELEVAASIIKSNPKIKSRLQAEAEDLNYLPKRARLNFD